MASALADGGKQVFKRIKIVHVRQKLRVGNACNKMFLRKGVLKSLCLYIITIDNKIYNTK